MFEHRTDQEIGRKIYIISPSSINTIEKAAYWDKAAVQGIKDLEENIEQLKQYRQMLFNRTQVIAAAPYKRVLKIIRNVHYKGSKSYAVSIVKDYGEGIGAIEEMTENYEGKKRSEALKRFAKLQKENPGIEIFKDIEKRKWEK